MGDRDVHPIDDLLSGVSNHVEPTQLDREKARSALADVMASKEAPWRQRRRAGWERSVLVGAAIVGLVIAIGLTQGRNPAPAQAALLEIARAAELVEPISIPEQSYAYTYSESKTLRVISSDLIGGRDSPLAAIFPEVREFWLGSDGTIQIRTTAMSPVFFSDQDEQAFYAAGLREVEGVGVTTTRTYEPGTLDVGVDWSQEPDGLLAQFKGELGSGASDAEVTQAALTLLRETGASPALRASVLRVVSGLDEVTLGDRTEQSQAFRIEFEDQGTFQIEFVLDSYGSLLSERLRGLDGDPDLGVMPNDLWEEITYRPTIIVDGLTAP